MGREYLNTLNDLFTENTIITEDMNGKFFYFRCKICGDISSKGIYFRKHKLKMFSLNCSKCNRKQTNIERFGCENPFQNESVKKKIKETVFIKYGVENVNKLSEVRNKIENTRQERYGKDKKSIVEKSKKTFIENYGVDNPQKNASIREKTKNTNIERYGGVPNCFGTDDFYKSMINLYGVKHALQSRDIRLKTISRYFLDDMYFDSSWEVCLYIFLKDHNIDFEYHPFRENLTYIYEGKSHHYTPDFRIENTFIEIKGCQFLKDGELVNPYQNIVYHGLKEIIENLGVRFLQKEDLQDVFNYVNLTYGKNYVKSLRFKNTI